MKSQGCGFISAERKHQLRWNRILKFLEQQKISRTTQMYTNAYAWLCDNMMGKDLAGQQFRFHPPFPSSPSVCPPVWVSLPIWSLSYCWIFSDHILCCKPLHLFIDYYPPLFSILVPFRESILFPLLLSVPLNVFSSERRQLAFSQRTGKNNINPVHPSAPQSPKI